MTDIGQPYQWICPTCGVRTGTTVESLDAHEYEKHDRPRFDGRYTADPACVTRHLHHLRQWCPECRGYA